MNFAAFHRLDDPLLMSDWDALAAVEPEASVFRTRAWCAAACETVDAHVTPHVIVATDARGAPLALLPCGIEHRGGSAWLKLLGHDRVCGDHLGLLCPSEQEHEVAVALAAHLTSAGDWGGLCLGGLSVDNALSVALKRQATNEHLLLMVRESHIAPYVDLPATFEDYIATRSSNMRYQIRRRRREMLRTDAAAIRAITTAESIAVALDELFDLHARRWALENTAGVFTSGAKREFLKRFCRAAAENGWLRCHVLEVGGTPHGALLAFHYRGVASFYQMGWDPASPVESPGVLLLAASIEQAIADGCRRYDFLRGDEPYKARWTSESRVEETLVVGMRAMATAGVFVEQVGRQLKGLVRRAVGVRGWQSMKHALQGARR